MALAGVALEISLARFMASMAAFSKMRELSRRFCRSELFASIVEGRGSCQKMVLHAGPARPIFQ